MTSPANRSGEDEQVEQVLRAAREAGVEFIHLQFIDIPGTIKGLSLPTDHLASCLTEGIWFDGSSVEGLARIAESDLYLLPDLATFGIIPWEKPTTARLICNLVTPGRQPFPADPRYVLRRALDDAAELGLSYRAGAEVEFYLFEDPAPDRRAPLRVVGARSLVPADRRSYFELPDERAAGLCQEAMEMLRSLGYRVAATHHEVSPGQHEIDLVEDDALRTADAIVTLKLVIRALAHQAGLLPTFMPKPIDRSSGSGLHLTQVLLDRATERGSLFEDHGGGHLSTVGQHFVAGQLAHARGMCAVLAPLVNSYKRLEGGDEAPATVAWARVNRGSFIRVSEAQGPGSGVLEVRAPDPSCNPYLALVVLLQCGLDGLRAKTSLPGPDEPEGRPGPLTGESAADPLPSTLGEALEEIGRDMTVRSALGQPVYERFLAAKDQEWVAYRHHISSWEIEAYLENA